MEIHYNSKGFPRKDFKTKVQNWRLKTREQTILKTQFPRLKEHKKVKN